MNKLGLQIFGSVMGFSLLGTAVGVDVAQVSGKNFLISRASNENNITLNSQNSPTLSNGSGTIIDDKGVTWEYFNASDYANGHVTLNSQSYVGVSSASAYGITAINSITVDFSGDELWLLKSVDGTSWNEDKILTSDEEVISSNGWRYVRFYNYSSTVNINSISINYDCSGISGTEDVDSAHVENVVTVDGVTYEKETVDLSPNSIDGEAVKFTKSGSAATKITMGFGKTYKIGDIKNASVEFDMKTANIGYGKQISLMLGTDTLGSNLDSSKTNAYKCTNIEGDWYHIEVPVTALISTISGIYVNGVAKDKPHTGVENKEIDGIRINAGSCIIDNLRISSTPCELGIFNSPTYKPTVGEFYWLKVAWVGKLYPDQVQMTFNDDTLARRVPLDYPDLMNGSPFYLEILASGTLTITCTVVSGYNRLSHSIQFTVTIQ